jgi:leucyl aminopeptidase
MRFENLTLSQFLKDSHPFSVLTLFILSESEWKKKKLSALLSPTVKNRVENSILRLKNPLKPGSRFCVPGQTREEEDFWIALHPSPAETFHFLEFARDCLKQALHPKMKTVRIVISEENSDKVAEAFGAALSVRIFPMPVYGKREKEMEPWQLGKVEIISAKGNVMNVFQYGYATGEGTNLARYLATLPPNILDTAGYGKRIREICKKNNLSFKFYSNRDLKKMGAGAFTAVDQGNPESQGGIYEIGYTPKKGKNKKTIHLVGKGMCFDTGGYDVKTGGNMLTMKGDMQGSAVALATLVTAARLGLPLQMKAFMAVTENHISPKAYKPDEVVTALNGLTIEVVNTDAEGRMVLADTLTLASRGKPDLIVDFATLTGSAIRSIGTRYSAGFTNREEFHESIREAGQQSGERIWTFPIDSSFAKPLESKIADTLQCVKGPGPDHIQAAYFLSRFVGQTPWVHIDLSAAENEGGIGHVDSLFTGFGVRWALQFINAGK